MSKKLTKPQADLLAELRESSTGGLWIRYYSRWSRSMAVLVERGLARRVESAMNEGWYEPVEDTEPEGDGSNG